MPSQIATRACNFSLHLTFWLPRIHYSLGPLYLRFRPYFRKVRRIRIVIAVLPVYWGRSKTLLRQLWIDSQSRMYLKCRLWILFSQVSVSPESPCKMTIDLSCFVIGKTFQKLNSGVSNACQQRLDDAVERLVSHTLASRVSYNFECCVISQKCDLDGTLKSTPDLNAAYMMG